jgi:hypothetical protein
LPVEQFEHFVDAAASGFVDGLRPAHLFHASEVDELPATGDESIEFLLLFGRFLRRPRLHALGKKSQRFGIDDVGFGEPALAKSRTWRGLTTATAPGICRAPAAANMLVLQR